MSETKVRELAKEHNTTLESVRTRLVEFALSRLEQVDLSGLPEQKKRGRRPGKVAVPLTAAAPEMEVVAPDHEEVAA